MGEFVGGIASVVGDTRQLVVTFSSNRELLTSERVAFANAIQAVAESFDCTTTFEDIPV